MSKEVKNQPTAKQYESTRYDFSCPQCGEYFEEESSMNGKEMECMCGCKFQVKS